jgi:hypothetical protein
MTMILDVCSSLAGLMVAAPIEATPVVLDAEPLVWSVDTLYVYPVRVDEVPFETAASRRQEFDLAAVFVRDNNGEEAKLERDPALAIELDNVRGSMMAAVRDNQSTPLWGVIRALTDNTSPRTLDKRSAMVRVTGWRIVGG